MNSNEFLQGQRDCKDGVEHKAGQSKEYDNGYNYQYERDAVNSQITLWQAAWGMV